MKKKGLKIIVYVAGFLTLLILVLPVHIRRALIHGHAGIYDYTLFSNREVPVSNPQAWEHDSLYNQIKISSSALATCDSFGTTAFVVIRNRKMLHEEYWDGSCDTTRSNSFSVAKSVVSLLIGSLMGEGKITSLDQPVSEILLEFKRTGNASLTLKNLLSMSSGIEWDEGYSSLFSPTTKAYYGEELNTQMNALNVIRKPGQTFEYQSCNTQILAMVVEKLSGTTLSAYASEKLWKPLGAEHPALWSTDHSGGMEKAYCCFNSTAADFARIGQLVLDSGQCNGVQIIPKDYIAQATAPVAGLTDPDGVPCNWYGYQFWILNHQNEKVVYARGILGQYIFIIPGRNAVVVRLGNERSSASLNHAPLDAYSYLDEAFRIMDASR
jgi:CubicO group peptidase (beta-lactamase class C family)